MNSRINAKLSICLSSTSMVAGKDGFKQTTPLAAVLTCAGALLIAAPWNAAATPVATQDAAAQPVPAVTAAPVTVLQLPRLAHPARPFSRLNEQDTPGLAATPGGAAGAAGGADEEEKTYHILKVNHIYVGGIANLFQNAGHILTEDFLKEQSGGGGGGFGGGGQGGGYGGGGQGGFGGGGQGGFGGGGGGFGGGGGGFGGGGFGGGGQGGFGGGGIGGFGGGNQGGFGGGGGGFGF